jgi:ribonuclease HII
VDDLVVLTAVPTVIEASIVCDVLREEGIPCYDRATNFAVGAGDGYPSPGPREIVVRAADADRARDVIGSRPSV